MDIAKRLSFLDQAQTLLNKVVHNKDDKNEGSGQSKLNSYFGFLSKEIRMKHRSVRFFHSDQINKLSCKRCFIKFSEFDVNNKHSEVSLNIKLIKKKHRFMITCQKCNFKQRIIFEKECKTQNDKLLSEKAFVLDVKKDNKTKPIPAEKKKETKQKNI